jgi:prepilin-type N-terminal cleavage/methylation domain-containing protein
MREFSRPDKPPSRGGFVVGAALLHQPARRRLATAQQGFTLVELVVVMLLVSILATVGASRFADREPFAAQALADQLVSGLRLAQATAMARRAPVYVQLVASPPAMQVCADLACGQALQPPGGGAWLSDTSGLTLSAGSSFNFNAIGAPSLASALVLQVNGSGGVASKALRVETVSGHVHQP